MNVMEFLIPMAAGMLAFGCGYFAAWLVRKYLDWLEGRKD